MRFPEKNPDRIRQLIEILSFFIVVLINFNYKMSICDLFIFLIFNIGSATSIEHSNLNILFQAAICYPEIVI